MYSKVKILGHPVHAILVTFPVTFIVATFACFLTYAVNGSTFWYQVGYVSNMAAIATAIVAAVPGFIDWYFGIPRNTEARSKGLAHALLNTTTLVLFLINAGLLWDTIDTPPTSVGLSLFLTGVGVVLTTVSGFLGFDLVGRHKVGVQLSPEQETLEKDRELRRSA